MFGGCVRRGGVGDRAPVHRHLSRLAIVASYDTFGSERYLMTTEQSCAARSGVVRTL